MPLEPMPTIPAAYDVVWGIVIVAVLVFTVTAAISQLRHSSILSGRVLAVWLIITIVFPPLGGIVWFLAGRPTARQALSAATGPETEPPGLIN